jgi:hypothetical protein
VTPERFYRVHEIIDHHFPKGNDNA